MNYSFYLYFLFKTKNKLFIEIFLIFWFFLTLADLEFILYKLLLYFDIFLYTLLLLFFTIHTFFSTINYRI